MAEPEQTEAGQTVSNLSNFDESVAQNYANIASSVKGGPEARKSDQVGLDGQDDTTGSPAAPAQSLLDQQNGVDLYLTQSGEPWLLPVDTLVLPVGKEGGVYGSMAQAVLSLLDEGPRSQLTSEILVRSFSFVGDPQYDNEG